MPENKKPLISELTKGIIKENPTLVMLLGMCPTLAVTTQAMNGLGMGLATTFVLLGSNIVISALRKVIPDKVRIPAFIVIIASFVTLIGFLLEGFVPSLYDSLGIYLTLITVNCIIFGRAEMFASKNNVVASALDAIGMGIGFTIALFIMPAGGFFTLGCIIAAVNKLTNKKPPLEIECGGCEGCPMADKCSSKEEDKK